VRAGPPSPAASSSSMPAPQPPTASDAASDAVRGAVRGSRSAAGAGPGTEPPGEPGAGRDAEAEARGVTAVLVAHDGARWLPEALRALARQTLRPGRVVGVDTGSTDGSGALLRDALGADAVVTLPRSTGYPDAVAAGLRHAESLPLAPPSTGPQPPADPQPPDASARVVPSGPPASSAGWVWLLHDDAAPDPDCLEALLAEAARQPSAALLGPKVVDWRDPRLLVEVGITTDRSGSRVTGLERRELDQGQHDAVRDVLAVGTAGALARRDVWDALGGLDPALPLFRDELDLGWRVTAAGLRVLVVPAACTRHARAATTGRRATGALSEPATRADRRHALQVLLAHASRRRLLLALPALVLGSLLRAAGFLLLRRVPAARDEVVALGGALRSPRRLRARRRARARSRMLPPSAVRPLLASRSARLRGRVEALAGLLTAGRPVAAGPSAGLGDPGGAEDDTDLRPGGPALLPWVLSRPPVLLVLALLLVALLAERAVLPLQGGLLSGGRLLPTPDGARDVWAAYAASWSDAGVGTSAPAPPRVAVLAGLSTLLLGKPWLAVDVLLLASVPLAGLTAWLAARRVTASPLLRLWAAATWALLPVGTGAIAAGRLDAAFVQITLPLLGLAVVAVLRDDPRGRWHRAFGAGLLLTLVAALAPTLWLVAALVLGVAAVAGVAGAARARRAAAGRAALAALTVLAVPVVLLLPWTVEVLRSPALLLHGPGRLALDPALTEPSLPAWHLPLLSPGGAGLPPLWVTAGLLAAALAGLVRRDRRREVNAGWAVALGGLLAALVLSRTSVAPPAGGSAQPVWPGLPLQVAAAGLLLAAVVAGDGLRARLARADFGWRQLTATALAATAAVTPLAAAAAWVVRGADDPLDRRVAEVVPAFVLAELEAEPGVRALVLRGRDDGSVGYELRTAAGARLGTADLPLAEGQTDALDAAVADLVTARGSAAAEALATRGVRYVALTGEADGALLADVLDAQRGLLRRSEDPVLLWQVQAPSAHLSVLPPDLADAARNGDVAPDPQALQDDPPEALPSTARGTRTELPEGPDGRLLVLAEARDAGWEATLDGRRLEPTTAWGWAQAFELPGNGGDLVLRHDAGPRSAAVALQALGVVLVAVLAVPPARRRDGLEPDLEPDAPGSAAGPAAPADEAPADEAPDGPSPRGGRP
jgi:GT2 family glycosyltransferase